MPATETGAAHAAAAGCATRLRQVARCVDIKKYALGMHWDTGRSTKQPAETAPGWA